MCPVYSCRKCRDTGLIRLPIKPFKVVFCRCRHGRMHELRADLKKRELDTRRKAAKHER